MTTDHEFAVVASTTDVQKVVVAIELSKSTWVVAIQPSAVDKVSLFRIAGGEIERLFELFEQARRRAGQPIEICACYEAGYDGFWIYRALTARGVACTVLDSASIQVSRRARREGEDRQDRCGKPGPGVDGDLPRRTPSREDCSGPHTRWRLGG